jgi:hypothetical protein
MRRASAELGLGARLALVSRRTRTRTGLTAAGVALGVAVLLLAASVPHAVSARDARERAATPVGGARGPLLLLPFDTVFNGVTIAENAVEITGRRDGRAVPLPPGVTRLPGPGDMLVSPEVQRLLAGPHGAELRRRLGARVVGTIGAAGLSDPGDALLYRGGLGLAAQGADPVTGFGAAGSQPPDVIVTLLTIVIVIALLLPVAVFVATAARFGSEERDRRLAAMRLVGADRLAVARVAAGETLVGAFAGLLGGALVFLAVRPLVAHIGIAGVSVFIADLRPAPWLVVLVVVLVPACAVAATLLSIRRVVIEPLGVTRRGSERHRRLGWRVATPVLGFLVLAPLVGSGDHLTSTGGQAQAGAGVMLVLTGVTAILPWLTEALVRHAPDGPLPWLLAIRRLRSEEGTTGRVVGAIGLAVAGAIALSIVFSAAQSDVRVTLPPAQRHLWVVSFEASSRAAAHRDVGVLGAVHGVDHVRAAQPGLPEHGGVFVTVNVFLSRGGSGAAGRLRDRASRLAPLAQVTDVGSEGSEAHTLDEVRRSLVAGAVVVLLMIGASLLVVAGEGLRERRRALAVLSAVGARRATVAWSMMWQAAIPVALGLVLAVALGLGLGAMLTTVVQLTPSFDWGAIAVMLAAGAGVIAGVTALTLPTLARMMRPDALRVE